MKISAQSLGSLAPYVVSAAIVLPPTGATARASAETPPEALIFVDVAYRQGPQSDNSSLKAYSWDLRRPELTPYSFVHIAHEVAFETYEPFIASEGWRDVSVLEGPFQVEEEARPTAFFDEYDLSTIALYGRQR
jgi:hypothetical protein